MELAVATRAVKGKKNSRIRRLDQVPAVIYAKHIETPLVIQFRRQDFIKAYKTTWSSTPLMLKGEGIDEMVLVHDIQIDPVSNVVLHVDFLGIKKGEKVQTDVPVILTGVAPVAKSGDGRVQQVKDSIHIEANPMDLPHELELDISGLETSHDGLFVRDIVLPKGVVLKDDGDVAVVTVTSLTGADVVEDGDAVDAEAGAEEATE